MKNRLIFVIAVVSLLLILTSCGPTPTTTCPPSLLTYPILYNPPAWSVVDSLSPTLTWGWPTIAYTYSYDYTTYYCRPENYMVRLSKGPFFNDDLGETVAGDVNSFTPASSLQAGQTYKWSVIPISEEVAGPSNQRYFYTGESCAIEDMNAVALTSPYNNQVIDTLMPQLIWENFEECQPHSYRIDLSTDPTFADTSLSGGTASAGTVWMPGDDLTDCTQYYWKVTPMIDTTLGPTSSTFTFYTNTGSCSDVGGASISGMVWEDLCSLPDGPAPSPLPYGCMIDADGVKSNGELDPGEPGISNVLVRLGTGSCPSSDMGATLTDSSGHYYFGNLPAGDYCVSVSASENSFLLPGHWVWPIPPSPSAAGVSDESTLDTDTHIVNNDFGWHKIYGEMGPYATIYGVVFEDECSKTWEPASATPPTGCTTIYKDSALRYIADGVRQTGEAGIPGVTINVYRGYCSTNPNTSQLYATTQTDGNGEYHFLLPNFGFWQDYCIEVDATSTDNAPILLPGYWSLAPEFWNKELHHTYNFEVYDYTDSHELNYGWDRKLVVFEFDPGDYEIELPPWLHVPDDGYCYEGPSFNYRALKPIRADQRFTILGMDVTHKWFLVNLEEDYREVDTKTATPTPVKPVRCWIPDNNAEPNGNLDGIGIFAGPKISTPTLTPTPTSKPPEQPATDPCNIYTTQKECARQPNTCTWKWLTDTVGICYSK